MKTGPKEAEFRNTFRELGETGQDRLLDMAHALYFALKTRYSEGRPGKCGEPRPNSPNRATCKASPRTSPSPAAASRTKQGTAQE
jgi:hypothetical protein